MRFCFLDWMRDRSIWLGETEDKLRIAPPANGDGRAAGAAQHLAHRVNRYLIGVCPYQECPLLDAPLPLIRLRARYTCPLKGAGDIAGDVPGRFTERC
jgi:hypothetical protein